MKKIVILGAGFGGLYTARYLMKKCPRDKITLIDRRNYFLFTPLLHEVATGGQNRHNVVFEIRDVLKGKNFEFCASEIKKVDFDRKEVYVDDSKLKYDSLVFALGSKPDYYIKGSGEYGYPLKTIHDAAKIRNRIISSLERASLGLKEEYLTFVIAGGGPTGVELVAEICEFIKQNLELYPMNNKDIKIYLIQRASTLVPLLKHDKCRMLTLERLRKKGINVMLNTEVREVKEDSVIFDHMNLKTKNVFLTAGVKPNVIKTEPKVTNKDGFFEVDEYFQVKGLKDVYAIGDCALNFNPGSKKPNPKLAQLATRQAKHLAKNFCLENNGKSKLPFVFKPDGFLVSVGEWWAIAELKGYLVKGKLAWWIWRTIYLMKVIGWKNRIRVGLEWFLLLFTKRDGSEV